jgi:hypothetical protein
MAEAKRIPAIAFKDVTLNVRPSTTCMQELVAFDGPIPPNHFVNCEKAKAAILHLQATDKGHGNDFTVALAEAMRALNKLTPYL